jgi:hypothetical protein
MCEHWPPCPGANSPNRDAARIVALHPEQGWYLLCNKVVLFDDGGELLPDGTTVRSTRVGAPVAAAAGASR